MDEIEEVESQNVSLQADIVEFHENIAKILSRYPVGQLNQLCEPIQNKCTPQKGVEYYYVGLEHIESNSGKVKEMKEQGDNLLSEKNKYTPDCVLYGKLRPYLNKVATVVHEGICSTDIVVLKTVYPLLLKYLLLSPSFVEQAKAKMKGLNHPRININDLMQLKIPVPPASQQHKIVMEIEKLEQQLEQAQAKIAQSEQQKQAILDKYLK